MTQTVDIEADCPTCGGLSSKRIEVNLARARADFAKEIEEDGLRDASDEELAQFLYEEVGLREPYIFEEAS